MNKPFYPYRNTRPNRPSRQENAQNLAYFEKALKCLAEHPERVKLIKENLEYYRAQPHLPNSAKATVKRFDYLLAVTNDPAEMTRWIMEDSYEGQKFRQMPLLLKGVCDN